MIYKLQCWHFHPLNAISTVFCSVKFAFHASVPVCFCKYNIAAFIGFILGIVFIKYPKSQNYNNDGFYWTVHFYWDWQKKKQLFIHWVRHSLTKFKVWLNFCKITGFLFMTWNTVLPVNVFTFTKEIKFKHCVIFFFLSLYELC